MKLYAEHIPVDRQGYDSRGRYWWGHQHWGVGVKLYHVSSSDGTISEYIRAPSAKAAKEIVLEKTSNLRNPTTSSILWVGGAFVAGFIVSRLHLLS